MSSSLGTWPAMHWVSSPVIHPHWTISLDSQLFQYIKRFEVWILCKTVFEKNGSVATDSHEVAYPLVKFPQFVYNQNLMKIRKWWPVANTSDPSQLNADWPESILCVLKSPFHRAGVSSWNFCLGSNPVFRLLIKMGCNFDIRQMFQTVALCLNPFPHNDTFWRPWETSLLKTLWEKEKLLVTSNFSFSRSVFYPFG